MNNRNNNNVKRNNGANAMNGSGSGCNSRKFCGHCKKLGKTEREYTSHFPRASLDVNALVTCPEILKTECSYCHEFGHWASEQHCPVLKAKIQDDKKLERMQKRDLPIKSTTSGAQIASVSKFALLQDLDSDSDADADDNVAKKMNVAANAVVDDFPVLGGGTANKLQVNVTSLSFIDAIKKPVKCISDTLPKKTKRYIMTADGLPRVFRNGGYMRNWADDSSDSDNDLDDC